MTTQNPIVRNESLAERHRSERLVNPASVLNPEANRKGAPANDNGVTPPKQTRLQSTINLLLILLIWGVVFSVISPQSTVLYSAETWASSVAKKLGQDVPVIRVSYSGSMRGHLINTENTSALTDFFSHLDYNLEDIRKENAGVPRAFVVKFPEDISATPEAVARKKLFIQTMLPLIVKSNDAIMADRLKLIRIADTARAGKHVTSADRKWLRKLADKYDIGVIGLDEMIKRVDIVPVPVALAQAAVESGWGTSRFAQEGNALFGQWTWDHQDDGIFPLNPIKGHHRVKKFPTLLASVEDYMLNLNTHNAYREFRDARGIMREARQPLQSVALTETLLRYSELGPDYITKLKTVMTENNLNDFQKTVFDTSTTVAEK